MKLFFVFLFYPILFYSQNIQILDKNTQKPISYVLVYFYNNNLFLNSEYSNENGELNIDSDKTYSSITLDCVGYECFNIRKEEIKNKVFLISKTIKLNEVTVSNNESILFGNKSNKVNLNYPILKNNFELSFFIENSLKKPCVIKNFKFFYSKKTNRLKYILRFRMYYKFENSNESDIMFELPNNFFELQEKNNKGVFTLDLIDYDLVLPIEGAFVSLEIIDIKDENDKDYVYDKFSNKDLLSISFSNDYPENYTMFNIHEEKRGVSLPDKNRDIKKILNANFVLEVIK